MGKRSRAKTRTDRLAARRANRHDMTAGRAYDMVNRPLAVARPRNGAWTWEQAHDAMADMAVAGGMWAGIPMPVDGFAFTVEPHYPKAETLSTILDRRNGDDPIELANTVRRNQREAAARTADPDDDDEPTPDFTCSTDDVGAILIRNSWWPAGRNARVILYETEAEPGRVKITYDRMPRSGGRRATLMLSTIGVASGWDLRAEQRAQAKLATMIPEHAMRRFHLTGCFIEYSPRSRVHYILRRGRPTVAMVPWDRTDPDAEDMPMKVLTVLCMHPIGYYTDTFAGAMVPTDDLIAHLLMIRSDEHLLWRRAYHHSTDEPEAGL